MKDLSEIYGGKTIVVTGAAGTIGREVVRQLAEIDIKALVLLDNAETELFHLDEIYGQRGRISSFLADIRDADKLARHFIGADWPAPVKVVQSLR